jgi:hypothetical protein
MVKSVAPLRRAARTTPMNRPTHLFLSLCACLLLTSPAAAAQYAPPDPVPVDDRARQVIKSGTDALEFELKQLARQGVKDPIYSDIEIYLKAAQSIVELNEFYNKDSASWTVGVLERGLLRASQARRGEAPWLYQPGRTSIRAYRSGVDGSIQPYAVTLPHNYGKGAPKRWRIDIVLHGRAPALTEVSFLNSHKGDKDAPMDQDWIQIDVFGRGNNAYRWAGESDVFEAYNHFVAVERSQRRGDFLDYNRLVLRGFSMGGAGTWHIGLHRPDRWCVIGPGAGFTTTHGYIDKLPQLPAYQEDCLHIYDAVDYAENAFNVPVVAYSGSIDKQKAAADNIENALKKANLSKHMTHLIGEGLAHSFPAEEQKKAQAEYAKYAGPGRSDYPDRVRFVTWTLKYSGCEWIDIGGLDRHYRRTLVDAKCAGKEEQSFTVTTENVRVLTLRLPPGSVSGTWTVTIDGKELRGKPSVAGPDLLLYLEKRDGQWSFVLPERLATERLRQPQKIPGQTGPIDDAFIGPFLCVRGTGEGWHASTNAYARANLERFQQEWKRYFRGELQVKNDVDVTPADLASFNIILFGDPASNSLIAQAMPGLPFTWTKDKITFDGKEYAGAEHVPVLIYPSPFNTERYVVLNSGHTFHAADLQGTNALLYPRLGDYAVLKLTNPQKDPLAVDVARAGLFDEYWHFAR